VSFICEVCKKPQKPKTKATKVVTEIRTVTYPPIIDKRTGRVKKIPTGTEIVKEVMMCPRCASKRPEPVIVGRKRIEE